MNRRGGRSAALTLTLAASLFVFGFPAGAADQEGCLLCHRLELRVVSGGTEKILKVHDSPDWIHETLYCSDCHSDARNAPHAVPPGTAQCIGECHGGSGGAIASHRRAAFAGFTESHRRVSPGRSPCRFCHAAADRKGERSAIKLRCEGCHGKERGLAAVGPHGAFANTDRFCVDCHPAHRETGGGATGTASCGGPGCHARASSAMRALVDHRGTEDVGVGKALLFFALAFAGWTAGRFLSPSPDGEGNRS